MISSVAAVLFWYSMRMKCCLASSREKTMIFAGSPARPDRNRRTNVFPSDPVPPMMRMRLPSKHFMFESPPLCVWRLITREILRKLRPCRSHISGRHAELFSIHAAIAEELVVREDFHIQRIRVAQQRKKLILRHGRPGDLIQSAELRMVVNDVAHHRGQFAGRCSRIHRALVAADTRVILRQKPFQQRLKMEQFPSDDGRAQG